jgi:molybdopterin/thiamine biosynthesis adenylyltransferase
MPDGTVNLARDLMTKGIKALDERVRSLGGERIPAPGLHKYLARRPLAGWQFWIEFSDGPRLVRVFVDERFPWMPPKFALAKPPAFLSWPHVERDGVLCLNSSAASFSPYDPVGVFDQMLAKAYDLIESLLQDGRIGDLRDEFLSYWSWAESKEANLTTYSLLKPEGPSRPIRIWRGKYFDLLVESDEEAEAWLRNRFPKTRKRCWDFRPAALIWTGAPLTPGQFPRTGHQMLAIAGDEGGMFVAELLAGADGRSITTILASKTRNGPCLARVTMRPPAADAVTKGFRPGQVPAQLVVSRLFSGATVIRSSVERVDSSWVHGRDQDQHHPALKTAAVTVLGCGSVGAAVAVLLAQTGVGKLRLVDPEVLVAANVGRHPLGIKCLGHAKAAALATELRSRFPHIQVEVHLTRWQDLPEKVGLFSDANLIVSAIGDWMAEGMLNLAHLAAGRQVPIIYGWTEAEALGGHAVLIDRNCGCLQCGLDKTGAPKFSVAAVPTEAGLKQEPACGAVYQPYGPTELSHIVAMIADVAIQSILREAEGGVHRVWIAGERRLRSITGASWTKELRTEVGYPGTFARIIERNWNKADACPHCEIKAAA